MWIERQLNQRVSEALISRPAVLITGARQTGKSSLIQKLLGNKNCEFISLDRAVIASEAEHNPGIFLSKLDLSGKSHIVLDEIQYAPSLFRELKIIIDNNRDVYGKWVLTGSQKFNLMQNVSETLAGRIRILTLETLSSAELKKSGLYSQDQINDYIYKGGYPELWKNIKIKPQEYFSDYVMTYLEKDLRQLINIANLYDFQRFMMLCATRIGQIVNFTDLSRDLGVNHTTIKKWLHCLEAGGIIYLLPPYYNNLGKRLIKSPKLYFADHGLASYLLNIFNLEQWNNSLLKGNLWENLVFCELLKDIDTIPGKNLFYYRDQNGVEIDFILEKPNTVALIEAKANEVPSAKNLNFNKVSNLFAAKYKNIENIVACLTQEPRTIHLKDYQLFNPLVHLSFL
jgi:predicted AAA+ superfamily ATPase